MIQQGCIESLAIAWLPRTNPAMQPPVSDSLGVKKSHAAGNSSAFHLESYAATACLGQSKFSLNVTALQLHALQAEEFGAACVQLYPNAAVRYAEVSTSSFRSKDSTQTAGTNKPCLVFNTLVTKMVASASLAIWKSSMSLSGYGQTTSEFKTKKGDEPSSSNSLASARGPAVPMGSFSCTQQGNCQVSMLNNQDWC